MNAKEKGTTLIETLVASAIFVVFSIAIYQLYAKVISLSGHIRAKTVATEVVSEQFEFVRNLPYASIGTIGGIPSGVVPPTQSIVRNGFTFSITTTVRNIDQPADGTLGGTPNDFSPADNKLLEIAVSCTSCATPTDVVYSSYIAPKNLETENGNGAMVLKAIDASGKPIVGATVRIINTALTPSINSTDVTDTTGVLTIVDAPPSTEQYQITLSKNGYSTDQSYPLNNPTNPNPIKPHLTVTANTVSQATFAIDKTSTINIQTKGALCENISTVPMTFTGAKLIGTNPDVLKTTQPITTDALGNATLSNLEWDTYGITIGGAIYDLIGTNPILPLVVPPGSIQQLTASVAPVQPNRLVVGVVDMAGLPLAAAQVSITGPSTALTKTTNLGSVSQTDWSGGGGQAMYINSDQFFFGDTSINHTITPGELKLLNSGGYASIGSLISSTFDLGAVANFDQLTWAPIAQPASTGATPVRVQIATNNDNATWNFLGPDGTANTYYTSPLSTISSIHNGNRYIRYKIFLSTNDPNNTPSVSDIGMTYTSGCLPPGQVNFGGLQSGSYTLSVSKTGYTTVVKTIILGGTTYETITLAP